MAIKRRMFFHFLVNSVLFAHLVYQPKSLYNHTLSLVVGVGIIVVICAHLLRHRVRCRNFILGIHMHICPPYMHIKYLVILTCRFSMAASHGDFISHILKYLFFTCIHKRNNATVTYFLKFMNIFFYLYTPYFCEASCALTYAWSTKAKFCTLS